MTKVTKLHMKPKIHSILSNLLHTRVAKPNIYPQIDGPYFLETSKMDFFIRKVLKYSGIKYRYERTKKILTINEPDSPFRLYMVFDDFGVTVRRIPWDEYSFFFQCSYPTQFIRKLIDKRLISPGESKYIRVPMTIASLEGVKNPLPDSILRKIKNN